MIDGVARLLGSSPENVEYFQRRSYPARALAELEYTTR